MIGVVFLAHGSPRPEWRVPLDSLVAHVTRSMPEGQGTLGFMEHASPSLAELACRMQSEAISRVVIFPLFISSQGHVSREVSAQVAEVREQFPDMVFDLMPALGELHTVMEGLRLAVHEVLD